MIFQPKKILTSSIKDINSFNKKTKVKFIKRPNSKIFWIVSGPPFSNGKLHVGHFLNMTYKSIIQIAKNVYGYDIYFFPAWDCHGLPIEQSFMKFLSLNNKCYDKYANKKLYTYEILRRSSINWINIQMKQYCQYGLASNLRVPIRTNSQQYINYTLHKIQELQKYIFKTKMVLPFDIKLSTCISQADIIKDKDVTIISTYYFWLKTNNILYNGRVVYIAIWTTTIWSIFGNAAISYNKTGIYNLYTNIQQDTFYISNQKILDNDIYIKQIDNTILNGMEYWNLYNEKCFMIHADWVNTSIEESCKPLSTGFVGVTPPHHPNDYELYKQNSDKIKIKNIITTKDGVVYFMNEKITQYNDLIKIAIKHLNTLNVQYVERGMEGHVEYSDRSKDQFIMLLSDQIAFDSISLKNDVLHNAKLSAYNHSQVKQRFFNDIISRPWWCISRQRLYGLPIPSNSIDSPKDKLLLRKNSQFTIDCWFESGLLLQYTWDKYMKKQLSKRDIDIYVVEGVDQCRGWFQHMLILNTASSKTHQEYPMIHKYIMHGHFLDQDGQKMSKSKGNVINPKELISTYSIDVIRMFYMAHPIFKDISYSDQTMELINNEYVSLRRFLDYLLNFITNFTILNSTLHIIPDLFKTTKKYHLNCLINIKKDNYVSLYKNILKYKHECSKFMTNNHFSKRTDEEGVLSSVNTIFFSLLKFTYIMCPHLCLEIIEEIKKRTIYKDISIETFIQIKALDINSY